MAASTHQPHFLFFLLGLPAWAIVNGTWSILGELVYGPEGYDVSAYLLFALSLGNIAPFMLSRRIYDYDLNQVKAIIQRILSVGFLASLLACMSWDTTLQIDDSDSSLVFFLLFFVSGACSASTSVTFFTLASVYPHMCTTALTTGMGVGSMLAGVFGLFVDLVYRDSKNAVKFYYLLISMLFPVAYYATLRLDPEKWSADTAPAGQGAGFGLKGGGTFTANTESLADSYAILDHDGYEADRSDHGSLVGMVNRNASSYTDQVTSQANQLWRTFVGPGSGSGSGGGKGSGEMGKGAYQSIPGSDECEASSLLREDSRIEATVEDGDFVTVNYKTQQAKGGANGETRSGSIPRKDRRKTRKSSRFRSPSPENDPERLEAEFLRGFQGLLLVMLSTSALGHGLVPSLVSSVCGKVADPNMVLTLATGLAALVDPCCRALTGVYRLKTWRGLVGLTVILVLLASVFVVFGATPADAAVFAGTRGHIEALLILAHVAFIGLFVFGNSCMFLYMKDAVPAAQIQHGYRWGGLSVQVGALAGTFVSVALLFAGVI